MTSTDLGFIPWDLGAGQSGGPVRTRPWSAKQIRIVQIVREGGVASNAELSRRLDTTNSDVRNQLRDLHRGGALTHPGKRGDGLNALGPDVDRYPDLREEEGRATPAPAARGRAAIVPWWRDPRPTEDKVCYQTRSEALRSFLDANRHAVDRAGGLEQESFDGSWDAINRRYGYKGGKTVASVRDAFEAVLPPKRPYCLDEIDLDTLNETVPAKAAGGFRLPDWVEAHRWTSREREHYDDELRGGRLDGVSWVVLGVLGAVAAGVAWWWARRG